MDIVIIQMNLGAQKCLKETNYSFSDFAALIRGTFDEGGFSDAISCMSFSSSNILQDCDVLLSLTMWYHRFFLRVQQTVSI